MLPWSYAFSYFLPSRYTSAQISVFYFHHVVWSQTEIVSNRKKFICFSTWIIFKRNEKVVNELMDRSKSEFENFDLIFFKEKCKKSRKNWCDRFWLEINWNSEEKLKANKKIELQIIEQGFEKRFTLWNDRATETFARKRSHEPILSKEKRRVLLERFHWWLTEKPSRLRFLSSFWHLEQDRLKEKNNEHL